MQEVRGRMVLADRLSAWGINVELHGDFVPHSAALDHAVVHNEAPSRYLRIGNLDLHTMLGSYGPTGVTDLSTRFAVEGRALEHQFDALPRVRLFDFLAIHNDGDQWASDLGALVAHKGR